MYITGQCNGHGWGLNCKLMRFVILICDRVEISFITMLNR